MELWGKDAKTAILNMFIGLQENMNITRRGKI